MYGSPLAFLDDSQFIIFFQDLLFELWLWILVFKKRILDIFGSAIFFLNWQKWMEYENCLTVKLRMLITGTSLTHLFVTIEFSLLYRQANHWDLSISIGTLPFYIKQPRRIDLRHRVAKSQERDSFWRERLVGLCFITKQLLEECRALAETFPRCVLLKS